MHAKMSNTRYNTLNKQYEKYAQRTQALMREFMTLNMVPDSTNEKCLAAADELLTELMMLKVELEKVTLAPAQPDGNASESLAESGLKGHQPKALRAIKAWLADPGAYKMFALLGVAGAGKSTLMSYILNDKELSSKYVWHLTATTNKAVGNLAFLAGNRHQVVTVHSKLGLVMEEVETRVILTKKGPGTVFGRCDVLVVDEGSMANKQLLQHIQACGVRVLFLGDPYQLPPVGEDSCPAFDSCIKHGSHVRMTKVLRFDSELLDLSVQIRQAIKEQNHDFTVEGALAENKDPDYKYHQIVLVKTRDEFEDRIRELKSPKDFLDRKILAWRNRTVAKYNRMVRSHFGFAKEFYVGEIVSNLEPVKNSDGTIVCSVDTELEIIEVEFNCTKVVRFTRTVDNLPSEYTIPCTRLRVTSHSDFIDDIYVVEAKEGSYFNRVLNQIAAVASEASGHARSVAWKNFWRIKGEFTPVRHSYCSTVHKIQGSTLKEVFVDQGDILANPDTETALRCLYVACTRAKERLWVV